MDFALCTQTKPLCHSHIIPEFAYKPAYDAKHRAVVFDPLALEKKGFEQKGARSRILCPDCETLVNDRYEKPFREYWLDNGTLARVAEHELTILDDVDYASFKLFHLSVLFRAAVSDHPNYDEVQLGPHGETLRQMVLKGDPGEPWLYPIMCCTVDGFGTKVVDYLITPAHRIRLYDRWGHYFVFCGCQWWYMVSSTPIPQLAEISLSDSGRLPVLRHSLLVMRHYRAQRTRLKLD